MDPNVKGTVPMGGDNDFVLATLMDEAWSRTFHTNRLVLMVKEPHILHAYWEVHEVRKQLIQEHFQLEWRNLTFFLQLYDVTHIIFDGYNAISTRRIPVFPTSDNWYIHDVSERRRYLLDFGTVTKEGGFFSILRSNIIETPPHRYQREYKPYLRFAAVHHINKRGEPCQSIPSWQGLFNGYSLNEEGVTI